MPRDLQTNPQRDADHVLGYLTIITAARWESLLRCLSLDFYHKNYGGPPLSDDAGTAYQDGSCTV